LFLVRKKKILGEYIWVDLLLFGEEMALARQAHISCCYSDKYLKKDEFMLEFQPINL